MHYSGISTKGEKNYKDKEPLSCFVHGTPELMQYKARKLQDGFIRLQVLKFIFFHMRKKNLPTIRITLHFVCTDLLNKFIILTRNLVIIPEDVFAK